MSAGLCAAARYLHAPRRPRPRRPRATQLCTMRIQWNGRRGSGSEHGRRRQRNVLHIKLTALAGEYISRMSLTRHPLSKIYRSKLIRAESASGAPLTRNYYSRGTGVRTKTGSTLHSVFLRFDVSVGCETGAPTQYFIRRDIASRGATSDSRKISVVTRLATSGEGQTRARRPRPVGSGGRRVRVAAQSSERRLRESIAAFESRYLLDRPVSINRELTYLRIRIIRFRDTFVFYPYRLIKPQWYRSLLAGPKANGKRYGNEEGGRGIPT
ncbi:hypothetical protein EVAR_41977_1 [Eumeta japonica]|uniref:Uncharacterized protein n=1 Tax=Eumeta variegata TaxID=151549 RepID=A0A4C1WTC1_EUMVA|nr:hypothetical protein EVAR_41977_1 [Eumeta japonica]